jgi:hypothetical protein
LHITVGTVNINLDVKNNNGDTPLMLYAKNGLIDFVELYISKGADASVTNKYGLTAYDLAATADIKEMLKNYKKESGIYSIDEIATEIIEMTDIDKNLIFQKQWKGKSEFENGIFVNPEDLEDTRNKEFLSIDKNNVIFMFNVNTRGVHPVYESFGINIEKLITNINNDLYLDCKRDGEYINSEYSGGVKFPFYGKVPKPYKGEIAVKLSTFNGQKYIFLKDLLFGLSINVRVFLITDEIVEWKYTTSYDMSIGIGKDHCQEGTDKKIHKLMYCIECK